MSRSNLPYDETSALILQKEQGLDEESLNAVFRRFHFNDLAFGRLSALEPDVWEARWFNDDSAAGYKAGDMVWINTERPYDFISAHAGRIYQYMLANDVLKTRARTWVDGDAAISAFYVNVLSGYTEYTGDEPFNTRGEPGLTCTNCGSSNTAGTVEAGSCGSCHHTWSTGDYVCPECGSDYAIYYRDMDALALRCKCLECRSSWTEKMPPLPSPLGPLYFIGDRLDPVQVRISLVDDNKEPPDRPEYWGDFFKTAETAASELSPAVVDAAISAAIQDHVRDYHLNGAGAETYSRYLNRTFDNLDPSAEQKFADRNLAHPETIGCEGFDCVELYVEKPIPDPVSGSFKCRYRWFRLWRSGFLEHGGVVAGAIDDEAGSSDISYGGRAKVVRLDWTYQDESGTRCSAPVYGYPAAQSSPAGSFQYIQWSNSQSGDFSDDLATGVISRIAAANILSPSNSYSVAVSPIQASPDPSWSGTPYPHQPPSLLSQTPCYFTNDVVAVRNNEFAFLKNDRKSGGSSPSSLFPGATPYYSYYCSGFVAR